MPMSVIQRAEKIMLNISSDLRSFQSEAYAMQDRTAQKTKDVYSSQAGLMHRKAFIEGLNLAGSVVVLVYYQKQIQALGPQASESVRQGLTNTQNHGIEFLQKAASFFSSLLVESPKISNDAESQKLGLQQQENSSLQSGWQNAIQTHESALQRLQNIESNTKAAG